MQNFPFEAEKLKVWFRREARDLPWRRAPTPYAVWISEVMLQQTQVSVVEGYFRRWMERFPTVEALAGASLEEVIKVWEGLGYYSRARHLHAAAQVLVKEYGGDLPSTREELSGIRGLGPYTVGAILSFAFRQKAAAVDGNVVRVLSRYFHIAEDVQRSSAQKKIREIAEGILPEEEPWLVAEGLIELGATVCKKDPQCWHCPIQSGCVAFALGVQGELPKKGKKIAITQLTRHVFVVVHGQEVLVRKGETGKVMADLYEFPYAEGEVKSLAFIPTAKKMKSLAEVEHSFTRYRVKLLSTLWRAEEKVEVEGHTWVPFNGIDRYPFSSGHRKILEGLRRDDAHITHGEFPGLGRAGDPHPARGGRDEEAGA